MKVEINMDESSWMTLKYQGKVAFERNEYAIAIKKYTLALQPNRHCPAAERQIILSNLVAARLQIGGPTQAEAAVENAKQCVALNDRWAKGHVRLASAYIALGGHSNDACNSLQRALQLDPVHPNARQMLIRELRREHAANQTNNPISSTTADDTSPAPEPSAPPQDFDILDREDRNGQARDQPPPQTQRPPERRNRAPNNPYQDHRPQQPNLDDHVSLRDRVSFYFHRARMWYSSLSDDTRTLLMVLVGLVLLYVAFGGRFGLEAIGSSPSRRQRGNYHSGNAYDKYYQGPQTSTTSSETQSGDYHYRTNSHRHYDSSQGSHTSSHSSRSQRADHQNSRANRDHYYQNDNDYFSQSRPTTTGNSFHLPNLFDGSIQSMLILAGITYLCHRIGLNPMQVIFFLNMMNGGRRRPMGMFRYGGGGMGGFGRRRW